MSNFEVLTMTRKNRPDTLKRIAWLENTAKQLREYYKRAPQAKKAIVLYKAMSYESMADHLIRKFEVKGV